MVKRTYKMDNDEPEKSFQKPSEKEHLFAVVDVYDLTNNPHEMDLGPDDVRVKLEVVGGDEAGRSVLHNLSLDPEWKGFFATRLFLKAVSLSYKGEIEIDTDQFIGRQFYATIVHNQAKNGKTYANISEYNFDKPVEQFAENKKGADDVAWDD